MFPRRTEQCWCCHSYTFYPSWPEQHWYTRSTETNTNN